MEKNEIAMQITLKAMECGLLPRTEISYLKTQTPEKIKQETERYAVVLADFYNSVMKKI